jgi:hypothetical protein
MDPFLLSQDFTTLQGVVKANLQEIAKLPKEKKVKKIKHLFPFQKTFSYDSAQGIAGVLHVTVPSYQETSNTRIAQPNPIIAKEEGKAAVVFKCSLEINRMVEHEHEVLSHLNRIRHYCPNFVGTVGLLPGYCSKTFYENNEELREEEKNLFDGKDNSIPMNYLLLEYVSDIDFKHVISYGDKTTVTGVLLGVLCALQIAQNKCKFTHYDLHTGNILMRKIEDDSYFAYVINNRVICYPTCGWYPVMIDMGSSYAEGIENYPTRSYIGNYQLGQQSTMFDPLADVHHFALHALSYLEKESKQSNTFCRHFRLLAGRVMHMFRNCEIWRYKGWKRLPCNLYYSFNNAVVKSGATVCLFYRRAKVNIVETLILGVKLPWKTYSIDEWKQYMQFYYPFVPQVAEEELLNTALKVSIEDVCHFLNVLDRDPLVKNGTVIIYALRCLSELCYAYLEENPTFDTKPNTTFDLPKELVNKFKVAIQYLYPHLSMKLDVNMMVRGVFMVHKVLRHLLSIYHEENVVEMKSWYEKTSIQSPFDLVHFIRQNSSIRYQWKPTTPIYIWNSDKEVHHKITFSQLGISPDTTNKQLYAAIKKM